MVNDMNINRPYSVAAVILAGGQGSRMGGEDKGLVNFQQAPMISWTLKKVSPLVSETVISCNRNHLRYSELGYQVISDETSEFLGPLAGIHAAISELGHRHSHLLILPCDTPLLNERLIKRLVEQSLARPSAISILKVGDRDHFLHAVVPTQYGDNLNQLLTSGVRAVYRWYKQYPLQKIDAHPFEHSLININQLDQLIGIA
jgi:molybdopterin-guanine dinucleotide biosynthesis protein A